MNKHPIIFGVSIIVYISFTFCRSLVIFKILLTSSNNIHDAIITKVARSKILFFDSNPVGRILARFSKDISTMDMLLPGIGAFATFGFFRTVTVTIILAVFNPLLIIAFAIAAGIMFLIYNDVIFVLNES